MTRYAAQTSVAVERSVAEIKGTLSRYGASHFMYAEAPGRARVAFVVNGRHVRFDLPLPDRDAEEFRKSPSGRRQRSDADAYRAWEQACRQRWRALSLVIKAKLEAVDSGIVTFEAEFLAHLVLPGDRTVGEWLVPQLDDAYAGGKMPLMLEFEGRK